MIRRILAAGSAVFALSAIVLLVAPATFAELLGLEPNSGTDWALRMMGAVLVALAGQMFVVRRSSERNVRQAAVVMIIGGGLMTLVTLVVPADWTPLRWAYLLFGLSFCLAYVIALIRERNYASNL